MKYHCFFWNISKKFFFDYHINMNIGTITSEHAIESKEHDNFLVRKAVLDSNMPKFIKFIGNDYRINTGILNDLCPNSDFVNKEDKKLLNVLENKYNELNLRPNKFLIYKAIDFTNILSVRHSVMIVGAPMTNKSSIMKVYLNGLPNYFKAIEKNSSIKSQL